MTLISNFNNIVQRAFEDAIRNGKNSVILKLNYKHKSDVLTEYTPPVKLNYKCPENPPGSGNFKCDIPDEKGADDESRSKSSASDTPKRDKKPTKGQLKKIRLASVDTPEFKTWFGKSVISEKNGSPKVVYHGSADPTHNTFWTSPDRKFEKSPSGLQKNETVTLGAWFTDNSRTAESFSKTGYEKFVEKIGWNKDSTIAYDEQAVRSGGIYPVYLSLQNPKVYEPKTKKEYAGTNVKTGETVEKDVVDDPFEQMMDDRDEFATYAGNYGKDVKGERGYWRQRMAAKDIEKTNHDFVAKLKAEGHDGIVIRNTEYDSPRKGVTVDQYVVFEPNQIKSIFNPKPTSGGVITNSRGVPEEYVPPVKLNYKCPENPPGSGNFTCDLPGDETHSGDKTVPDEKPKKGGKGKKSKGPWEPRKMPKYPERGVDSEFYREVENHLKKDVYTDEENIFLDGWRHKDKAGLSSDDEEIMAGIMEKSTVPWGSKVYRRITLPELTTLKEGEEISLDGYTPAYNSVFNLHGEGNRTVKISYPAGSHIAYCGDDGEFIIDKGSKLKITGIGRGGLEYAADLIQDEKPPAPKRPPLPKAEGFDVNKYNKQWRKYTGKRFPKISGGIGKMELDKLDIDDDAKKTITDTITDVEESVLKKLKLPGIRGIALYNDDFGGMEKSFAAFGDGVMWFNPKEIGNLNLEEDTRDGMVKFERERLSTQRDIIDSMEGSGDTIKDETKLKRYEESVSRIENALSLYDEGDDSSMPWNYSKDNVDKGIRPTNCIHYFETPEDRMKCVIYHEMGHAVHQLYGVRNLDRYEATMWNNNSYSPFEKTVARTMYVRDGAFLPSSYSIKNPKEWFAENFAMYKMGRHDCVDDEALKLFKSFEEGKK